MRILVLTLMMSFLGQSVFGAAEGGAEADPMRAWQKMSSAEFEKEFLKLYLEGRGGTLQRIEPLYVEFSDDGRPCMEEQDDGTEIVQTVLVTHRIGERIYVQKVHYKNMIGRTSAEHFVTCSTVAADRAAFYAIHQLAKLPRVRDLGLTTEQLESPLEEKKELIITRNLEYLHKKKLPCTYCGDKAEGLRGDFRVLPVG